MPAIATALLALPYVVSFAHPTYHAPAWPLVASLAAFGAERIHKNGAEFPRHRRFLVPGVLALVYIQVEWIVMMLDRIQ
jgi:hypothetical protein